MRSSAKGFTLIELMIVVVVVGVLLTIAVPAYQDSVRSARRSDAMAALGNGQMRQEKFRSNCPHYATGLGVARVCDVATPANSTMVLDADSPDEFYTLSVQAADADGYTLRATGKNGQEKDQKSGLDCRFIEVDEEGVYTPAGCVKR
ncbi:type IV pilin protein [Haliea sp. E1-2-M8]|uniref:type IV pilin protein n=1 Tax=Haliea sp. E1-2-M8 TaxID=3064706 RepID=UPI0027208D51|nr:type IV pilin protein [Haliea sp. E1-2-M8]MDO8864117.1 type IV pilin protein [Haliea sp. E1-2-M8]